MANSESYIPSDTQPFHTEFDGFRVWETATGYVVRDDLTGSTYRGDLAGVARFIERQRSLSGRG